MGEFDALSAVWCSCNPNKPTKVCPFCLQCFCKAPENYHEKFWTGAPDQLVGDREMLAKARGPLGEALIKARVITSDQLLDALKEQERSGRRLGEILVDKGLLNQNTLETFLTSQRSVTRASLLDLQPDPMLVMTVGIDECIRRKVVPVSKEKLTKKELLTLAMADPSDGDSVEFVQNVTGCQALVVQCPAEEIEQYLSSFHEEASHGAQANPGATQEAAGAKLAADLIRKAMARGASDLYVEPREGEISVHLRIDGLLYKTRPIPREYRHVLTAELKNLLRLPQDTSDRPLEGRVVMRSGEQRFDVVAHSLPTQYGENISLKIINRDTFFKTYDQLGLAGEEQTALREALDTRRGLVLITAPLFHGSTTTLYAIMKALSLDTQRKTMSIEAQSVCPVPNLSQISLGENKDAEATATTMKALSNIQPDVCILADLLDSAPMAGQMHKLVSQMLLVATLEADGTLAAVKHLEKLGYSMKDLSENLLLVLNQRLIRRLCPHCRVEAELSESTIHLMDLDKEEGKYLTKSYRGEGCEKCSGIGYKGREALFEILVPSASFRSALARGASPKNLEKEAAKAGMRPLRQQALQAVQEGRTSVEEFCQVKF